MCSGRASFVAILVPAALLAIAFVAGCGDTKSSGTGASGPVSAAPILSREMAHESHCIAVSRDGKLVASGGGGDIKLWDVASGQEKALLEGHAKSNKDSSLP